MVGQTSMAKCKDLTGSALKGLRLKYHYSLENVVTLQLVVVLLDQVNHH